jgi:hypothetical protein
MREHSYEERFFELLRRAEEDDYSPDTGPWLEEAFKLADEHADPEFGLLARYFYIFAVAPVEPHNAVVAFSWCVSHEEHCSPLIPKRSLVHLYGIVVGILRSYPDYSLEQIEATFQEMEAKFRQEGMPMRDVWHHRIYGALGVGNREEAKTWYELWDRADPRPGTCPVCDAGTRILYYLYREEYDAAFRWARPIWEGMRCDDGQPLMTASACLVPLLRTGDLEMAAHCMQISKAELGTSASYAGIWSAGRQLAYLSCRGPVDEAIETFQRHFPVAWTSGTPADRFGFMISCKLFSRRLADETDEVELRLPECELKNSEGVYDPDDLVEFFRREIADLGARFDRRNKNGEYTRIAALTEKIYEDVRHP